MSLPSINFLHLSVSEIQPGQFFPAARPTTHPDTMGEINTPTALKGCGVKMEKHVRSEKLVVWPIRSVLTSEQLFKFMIIDRNPSNPYAFIRGLLQLLLTLKNDHFDPFTQIWTSSSKTNTNEVTALKECIISIMISHNTIIIWSNYPITEKIGWVTEYTSTRLSR